MKRKFNILISAVLIILILPVQFACNKDKLQPVQTEDPTIEIPQEITLSAEEMKQYMGEGIDADSKGTYHLLRNTNQGWIITTLPLDGNVTEGVAKACITWISNYIADNNLINNQYVKNKLLTLNNVKFAVKKASLLLSIFDFFANAQPLCPESIFHMIISTEDGGTAVNTETDNKFDAGDFQVVTSVFQGDDQVNHWLIKLYEVSHNGVYDKGTAIFQGYGWLMTHLSPGESAMLIWDKRFSANENTAYYMVVYKNSFDNPNYFNYYSDVHLVADDL